MATYKYHGQMRYADDSKLWQQMLNKERGLHKAHRDVQQFHTFGSTAYSFGDRDQKKNFRNVQKDNLTATQQSGFYQTSYVKDEINHFSDPPYCIIKPGYRAAKPVPNDD